MIARKMKELGWVGLVSLALVILSYFLLRGTRFYGPGVVAMAALPLAVAWSNGIGPTRMVPDLVFGGVDTGLLTLGAVVGASGFGIAGAVVGGAVSDAVTDAIAGFFEGGVAEWLRSKGMEESRTALGSACGKMTGCLAGSGLMLCLLQLLRVSVLEL